MKNRLIDMAGNLIMVLGVMAFAYTIASPFVAPLWVSAILIGVTVLLLALAFKLWDIAEGRMTIEEAKKFMRFGSKKPTTLAVGGIEPRSFFG